MQAKRGILIIVRETGQGFFDELSEEKWNKIRKRV